MSINTAEIPQIEGDLDAVDGAGAKMKTAGTGFSTTGSDVHSTWQGLSGVYKAPEVGDLLSATAPVSSDAAAVGKDVGSVGSALSAYASEVRPIKAELERLKIEAAAFNSSIEGDDEWNKDEDKVNKKNGILKAVNAAVAAWQQAERTCASAINATFGGVQYRADDGDGTKSADEYGYSAEMLDGATAGDEGVPWGKASEVDKPWYKDVADGIVSFGKGLVVDGLWGAVRGLGTMVGVDGFDAAKQAWAGVGKLALSLNPAAMVIDQTVGIPGMEKGELGATQLAAGKALIAYDTWGEDPARASGAVVGNVLGAVIGTKGAGAAIKGSGTVAKVGGAASRTFPKTAELAANIGTKVGDLKINVASSLNTKMASLGEKISIPKFGPEPALAGAGVRGGNVFEMTPGTRSATSGAGVAARVDDAVPGAGSRGASGSGVAARVDDSAPSGTRTEPVPDVRPNGSASVAGGVDRLGAHHGDAAPRGAHNLDPLDQEPRVHDTPAQETAAGLDGQPERVADPAQGGGQHPPDASGPVTHEGARSRPSNRFDVEAEDKWASEVYHEIHSDPAIADKMASNLSDVERASGQRGFHKDEVSQALQHVMQNEHKLTDYETGGVVTRRFDASADMADAWLRIRDGAPKQSDLVLLEHEIAESGYMKAHPDATYAEAHAHANESANWQELMEEE